MHQPGVQPDGFGLASALTSFLMLELLLTGIGYERLG